MKNENCWAGIPACSNIGLSSASWNDGCRADKDGMLTRATGLGLPFMACSAEIVLANDPQTNGNVS